MKISLSCVFALGAAALAVGCGGGGPHPQAKRAKVTGKVTLDGKSLSVGKVVFDPGAGEQPGSFNIVDGSYEGMAPVGKNKVSLSAFKKVSLKEKYGRDGPGYDQPVEENMLPAKYSSDSKFEREVMETGPNEFNFELHSK